MRLNPRKVQTERVRAEAGTREPRNRMNELFTSGSAGGLAGQPADSTRKLTADAPAFDRSTIPFTE